jgi:nucleotide-binding universal stress UspA family protein
MKSILVPTFPDGSQEAVYACVISLARRNAGHVGGISIDTPLGLVALDGFVAQGDLAFVQQREAEIEASSAKIFNSAMTEAGLSPAGQGHPSFAWIERTTGPRLTIAEHARVFDVTVLPLPRRDGTVGSSIVLDECLFESGRAVLVVPPGKGADFGKHVVIAWNNSSETARTVSHGMTLLRAAERITVLGIDDIGVRGPPASALADQLLRHGLPVTHRKIDPGSRSIGQAFLEETEKLGGDLMFKGAYTQSRLRQMIFGGATAHLLAKATVPMLMAH